MKSREATSCYCENCKHFNVLDFATYPENDHNGKPEYFTQETLKANGIETDRMKRTHSFKIRHEGTERHMIVLEVMFEGLYAYENKTARKAV